MNPFKRRHVVSALNFESFLKTPLPSDQKLLTLLHFNLVRALTQNVFILNLNPDDMNSDLESPFTSSQSGIKLEALPEMLRPTALQRTVSHHPEVESNGNSRDGGLNGRTGLIAWGEPWLQASWEVEEGFARKYKDFFGGCVELLESTNHWRASRGEGPLILDLEAEDGYES